MFPQHSGSTWGRARYSHTQGILYAWLGNAFIAFLYYDAPCLTRRRITSRRVVRRWNSSARPKAEELKFQFMADASVASPEIEELE